MQMSGNMAVLAYNLACADEMMPRLDIARTSAHLEMVGGWFEENDHPHGHCGIQMEWMFQLGQRILP
jgi:hypothetical protein